MEELLTELRLAMESIDHAGAAQRRHIAAQERENAHLWQRIDDLNGGLAALSNRIESLARGLAVSPAEAAEAMMQTQRQARDADA